MALLGLLVLARAVLATPRAPDLDVAIPPGSPLDWGGSFPGHTPPERPLFPSTGGEQPDPNRSSATNPRAAAAADHEVRFAQSYGLLRILTWDLTAHLAWITQPPRGPISGVAGGRPAPPRYGDPLYWVGLAPLLRLMLHPEVTAGNETLAHLAELGDPLLPVLAAASAEKSLEPWLARLRALVPPGGSVPEGALEGSPRARLFGRFTREECLRDEPYDPVGEFGKRLFLFHEDALPWLETWAAHPSLALRRNAVAALSRYRTRAAAEALAKLAVEEHDPVTLVRALAALSSYRGKLDEAPLVTRALAETDPVLRAAWIGALGRIGARSAVPGLLALGDTALAKDDSELLLAVLGALAQIPPTADHARVRQFAERVEVDARTEPGAWRTRVPAGETPDTPDAAHARAQWIEQLTWLVRVNVEPLDEALHGPLLALARAGNSEPRGQADSAGLVGLAPGTRLLYLHALAQIGEPGQERLAALATERGLEAALRGRALALTSYDRRTELARRLAGDPGEAAEVRIQALEVMRADRHEGLAGVCRVLFEELLAAPALEVAAPQRFLWTTAVRELTEDGPLTPSEELGLWRKVRASPALHRSLRLRLSSRLGALFQTALEGTRGKRLEEDARAFLALTRVFAPEREERAERAELELLLDVLGDLRKHANETGYAEARQGEILQRLTGWRPPSVSINGFFEPSVPLEEEIVLALGRARDPAAVELLLQLLREPDNDLVGWIALALALSGEAACARELVPLLAHPEPFVRLCAGEALQKLGGRTFDHDWVYDAEALRLERARELERELAR